MKNRQARLLSELQRRIEASNSYLKGSEPEFDTEALYSDLQIQTERLVQLKSAINAANAPIQEDIYRMAELKGLAQFVRGLSTQRGKVVMGYMMGEPQEYEAQITAPQVAAEVERIESDIDTIQDRLDQHNATVSVEVDVPE